MKRRSAECRVGRKTRWNGCTNPEVKRERKREGEKRRSGNRINKRRNEESRYRRVLGGV